LLLPQQQHHHLQLLQQQQMLLRLLLLLQSPLCFLSSPLLQHLQAASLAALLTLIAYLSLPRSLKRVRVYVALLPDVESCFGMIACCDSMSSTTIPKFMEACCVNILK
jgi:hypothetical protein